MCARKTRRRSDALRAEAARDVASRETKPASCCLAGHTLACGVALLDTLLVTWARAYLRAETSLGAVRRIGNGAASGFFGALLSDAERARVSVDVYGDGPRRLLAGWEREWLARRLPAAPGRVLVGAAGTGPEVQHLRALGYSIDALEPSTAALRALRQVTDGAVCGASYEQLSAAVLEGARGCEPIAERSYDAILLGWGSLSHVLSPGERERLIRACHRLCPRGPILASFLFAHPAPLQRGRRAGEAIGRLAARALGRSPSPADEAFTPWSGFISLLSRVELETLARAAGRSLTWEADATYPHVTFTCA